MRRLSDRGVSPAPLFGKSTCAYMRGIRVYFLPFFSTLILFKYISLPEIVDLPQIQNVLLPSNGSKKGPGLSLHHFQNLAACRQWRIPLKYLSLKFQKSSDYKTL